MLGLDCKVSVPPARAELVRYVHAHVIFSDSLGLRFISAHNTLTFSRPTTTTNADRKLVTSLWLDTVTLHRVTVPEWAPFMSMEQHCSVAFLLTLPHVAHSSLCAILIVQFVKVRAGVAPKVASLGHYVFMFCTRDESFTKHADVMSGMSACGLKFESNSTETD